MRPSTSPLSSINRPELSRTRLAQRRACRVCRQSNGDGALLRGIHAGETTFSRAAARGVGVDEQVLQRSDVRVRTITYRPAVPMCQ